jgi:N-formylglutamate amidohydrolase
MLEQWDMQSQCYIKIMRFLKSTGDVPVIYSAHHASHNFDEFTDRVSLTEEQKVRLSDYGTDLTVPLNGITTVVAEQSRALGDLNRSPSEPDRFREQDFGQPIKHTIWLPGQELTFEEKRQCLERYYSPFHDAILGRLKNRHEYTYVVAWDNTAHYIIGNNDNGTPETMRPFILSNRGLESSSNPMADVNSSCDPALLELLAAKFRIELAKHGLPTKVFLNFVITTGYICQRYSSLLNDRNLKSLGVSCGVQSLQLEYDASITHNQKTLEPNQDNIHALRQAFSEAIRMALEQYEVGD